MNHSRRRYTSFSPPIHLLGALILLAVSACSNPVVPEVDEGGEVPAQGRTGRLVISAEYTSLSAATVFPSFDQGSIQRYRIEVTGGPSGAPQPAAQTVGAETGGAFPTDVSVSDLLPGSWTVAVRGLDDSGAVLAGGQVSDVTISAGASASVTVPLGLQETGTGSYNLTARWPTDPDIKALDYRVGNSGAWSSISQSEFTDEGGGTTRASVSASDVAAGSYWITFRLDLGPLYEPRYRAYVDELVYIYGNVATDATIDLEASDISDPPPASGSWEELEDNGDIEIAPDGGISYNPGGYESPRGGGNITVDSDGSITYSASGERRLYMDMPSVTAARLELTGVQMTQGNGWGVFFHAEDDGTTDYTGYTLQFDPGLGDRIVLRQWIDDAEYTPFFGVDAADVGVDLRAEMDVTVHLDGAEIRVDVDGQEIFRLPDSGAGLGTLVEEANNSSAARTEGFLGLRAWSSTDLVVEDVTLYVLE